jgi:hypothetical protein
MLGVTRIIEAQERAAQANQQGKGQKTPFALIERLKLGRSPKGKQILNLFWGDPPQQLRTCFTSQVNALIQTNAGLFNKPKKPGDHQAVSFS